jgi:cytochrome c oxidase subunit 3
MWAFLVTEVMFFGALFVTYTIYRWKYQPIWYQVHKELNIAMGATNTTILLASSFSVALAVYYAQRGQKKIVLMALGFTNLCAFGFLVIKYFEYMHKIHVGHLPTLGFRWNDPATAGPAELFYSLYFAMTGLHGIHVIVGIICITTLMIMIAKDNKYVRNDYIPIEMVGLYWHFVDLVWIFLFPLFYLMPG